MVVFARSPRLMLMLDSAKTVRLAMEEEGGIVTVMLKKRPLVRSEELDVVSVGTPPYV